MKAAILVIALFISGPLLAAGQAPELSYAQHIVSDSNGSQIEATRAKLRLKRLRIIENNLPLQQTQWQSFWQTYGDYMVSMDQLDDRVWQLINDYAEAHNNDSVDDEMALTLIKQQQQIQQDRLALRNLFTHRYLDVITPRQLARFYQLERRMDALLSISMAQQIPLIP
ncbi:MAG: hypothetical protein OQK12_12040 [Motiliproteus sp.]|nr:hypothetical protein [Motiliproteus sp.]MCW9052856.1 hypothetical protein [Motiliproteus sp.]